MKVNSTLIEQILTLLQNHEKNWVDIDVLFQGLGIDEAALVMHLEILRDLDYIEFTENGENISILRLNYEGQRFAQRFEDEKRREAAIIDISKIVREKIDRDPEKRFNGLEDITFVIK